MTDYERDQKANEWAHRYRWFVWGIVSGLVSTGLVSNGVPMLTVAVIAMLLALFFRVLWPTPEPALVCLLICVISLIFKLLP